MLLLQASSYDVAPPSNVCPFPSNVRLFAPTVTDSVKSLVKVQVLEAESHVPMVAQSPPVASSDIVISAKAFGTNIIPTRKIPKTIGRSICLVILYFSWHTNKSDLEYFHSVEPQNRLRLPHIAKTHFFVKTEYRLFLVWTFTKK